MHRSDGALSPGPMVASDVWHHASPVDDREDMSSAPDSDEDASLVRSLAARDEAALSRAYVRHGALVFGIATRVLGRTQDAEEVLQDVFLKLWRTAAQFDPSRGSLVGYLVTLVGLAFGLLNVSFALLFVLVAWGYGMLLSIWAVVLEEVSFRRYRRFGDLFRLLLFAALENFGYRQCTVWWRLKAFASVWRRVNVWGDMSRKGFGSSSATALLLLCLTSSDLGAQSVRAAAWGTFDGVTGSQDWSSAGAQLTLGTARGHAGWAAAEMLGRFGTTDVTARMGGVLHPGRRWWLSAEAGTASRPVFMPKNTWYADATALVAPRASLGIGYRRWNYAVGPVDIVIPHATLEASRTSWDLRLYLHART